MQDYVTISNSYLHDHWKGSLVGHSDNNQAEDTGHLYVHPDAHTFRNATDIFIANLVTSPMPTITSTTSTAVVLCSALGPVIFSITSGKI